jgi:hypothetical protein
MSKVYARTSTVPDGCDYITPGKLYECIDLDGWGFRIAIDGASRDTTLCLWWECAHLDGGHWERIETDGEPPETIATPSRYQLLTIEELEADLSAIECALQAKRAEETSALIDGVV